MLITKETDYALRILRSLANNSRMTIKEICEHELLPQQFVYKIAKKMAKASILEIVRGVGGGCRLTCDLNAISLLDLINIVDADKSISACLQSGYHCPWREQHGGCTTHNHLCQLQQEINMKLQSYSLYQILFNTDIGYKG